jgi:iron complex outermembrane receptor protein
MGRNTSRILLLAGVSTLAGLAQPALAQIQSAGAPTGQPPIQDQSGEQHAQPATSPDTPGAQHASGALPSEPDSTQIVVTGSRIPDARFDSIQPTVVLGSQQIANLGYTNLGDALSELPQFGVPGNSSVGAQSGFGAGQTFIDFFGLGSQRTLVLVNGRRFVSSNTASIFGPVNPGSQVDLNNIPETLVDRVETVAIGGAPIYGSDAIAGTVNIILKRNFDGFQISGQNGISQRGDVPDHRVSAIAGKTFDEGRGSIVVSGEWNKSGGLTTADRFLTGGNGPFFTTAVDPDAPYAQQLFYQHRYNVFTQYGTPLLADSIPEFAGITNAQGQVLTFNQQGRLVPLNFGTRTGSLIESSGGNGFDIDDFGNLKVRSQRYIGTALGSYQVSDGLRFFGEGWYSHSTATNVADQPYYSTTLFGPAGTPNGDLLINTNNPFLNPADRATIVSNLAAAGLPTDQFQLTRANTDLQSGMATSTIELYRFVGGVDGDFHIGDRPWHYEASVNYGHSTTTSHAPNLVFQNLQNALNATTDASGNIICTPGYTNAATPTVSSTCAPLDIFGQSNTAMQKAAIDYVTAIARSRSVDTQLVANINAQGTLFKLPGGDVKFSIGYEHRRESTSFDPGAFYLGGTDADGTREGFGNSIPIDPISGAFHTDEGFSELNVPLVSPDMGWRFLNKFVLEASARYVKNSLSGGGWTYTYGGEIAPVADLAFRGNFTHSIRSPAITEAFNPTSSAFDTGKDPCDSRYIGQGPNPGRRAANCASAGITQPFDSNYSDFTVPVTVSGNPNLKNEQADSYTFGTVIRPRWIPGLNISADYINISLKDSIVSLGGDDILNACYDASAYPSTFCGLITRDSTGQITLIKEGYYNAAIQKLKAVTAQLAYQADLSRLGLGPNSGAINLSFNFYHVIDQYQKVGDGDVNHTDGEIGNPKNSFTANADYSNGGFDILWQTQYYGPSKIDVDAPDSAYQYPGVKHWYMFNSSVGYKINKTFEVRFIVNNVFDKAPPFPVPATGANSTATYYAGLLGRYFKFSASSKF